MLGMDTNKKTPTDREADGQSTRQTADGAGVDWRVEECWVTAHDAALRGLGELLEAASAVVDPHERHDRRGASGPQDAIEGDTAPDVARLANRVHVERLCVVAVIPVPSRGAAVNADVFAGGLHVAALDGFADLGCGPQGLFAVRVHAGLTHAGTGVVVARCGPQAADADEGAEHSGLLLAATWTLVRLQFGVQSLKSQVPLTQHVMNLFALNLADRGLRDARAFLDLDLSQTVGAKRPHVVEWGSWLSHWRLFYAGAADYASKI
jgi:hypothetical protein